MAKDFAYSFGLKNVVILDVFLIGGGVHDTCRGRGNSDRGAYFVVALLVTTLGALFLALNKRKHELILLGEGAGTIAGCCRIFDGAG